MVKLSYSQDSSLMNSLIQRLNFPYLSDFTEFSAKNFFTEIHRYSHVIQRRYYGFFLLWEQVLDYINKNDSQYYQMFSYNVFPTSMTDTTLVITPNKPYLVRWINGVYREKLEQIVSRIAGKPMKVEVAPPPDSTAPSPQVPPAQKEAAAPSPAPAVPLPEDEEPLPTPVPQPLPETPAADPFPKEVAPPDFSNLKPKTADQVTLPDIRNYEGLHEPSLFDTLGTTVEMKKNFQPNPVNEEYTFETFVHGNCNEIAYQAAYAVAQTATNPNQADQKMNPLSSTARQDWGRPICFMPSATISILISPACRCSSFPAKPSPTSSSMPSRTTPCPSSGPSTGIWISSSSTMCSSSAPRIPPRWKSSIPSTSFLIRRNTSS